MPYGLLLCVGRLKPVASLALKALVQQISSGLYWKTGIKWVEDRENAEKFATSNAAILFCLATDMRDTRIIMSFGDPTLDATLYPFGEQGHGRTTRELIDESRTMKEKSRTLSGRVKAILATVLQTMATIKERRKATRFQRKKVSNDDPE